ncbi:hypothetical protein TNCV_2166811 [Trichonephila clavipes]|nr:hypothetical protein TNCV_2166811 [Trichonephila clavipes]
MAVRFYSIPPRFIERTPWESLGAFHLSSPSTNHTKGPATRLLFKVSPCGEDTIHLQTSMPSPGSEPRPNGTAVSVTYHYIGWAAQFTINPLFVE